MFELFISKLFQKVILCFFSLLSPGCSVASSESLCLPGCSFPGRETLCWRYISFQLGIVAEFLLVLIVMLVHLITCEVVNLSVGLGASVFSTMDTWILQWSSNPNLWLWLPYHADHQNLVHLNDKVAAENELHLGDISCLDFSPVSCTAFRLKLRINTGFCNMGRSALARHLGIFPVSSSISASGVAIFSHPLIHHHINNINKVDKGYRWNDDQYCCFILCNFAPFAVFLSSGQVEQCLGANWAKENRIFS